MIYFINEITQLNIIIFNFYFQILFLQYYYFLINN